VPYHFSISSTYGYAFRHSAGTCFHELISTHLALKGLIIRCKRYTYIVFCTGIFQSGEKSVNFLDRGIQLVLFWQKVFDGASSGRNQSRKNESDREHYENTIKKQSVTHNAFLIFLIQ